MKSKFKLLLLLALVMTVCSCIALTACGGGGDVSEIYFTTSNSPKLTYVKGQDLDLSTGALTVIDGGEETLVPLNAEGVSISGYDKDTIGEQTLTVTYKDCTTTINVTVVARMTVDGFTSKYFTKDKFDTSAGKVRIANDNGTFTTVNMSDPKISLVSFDSSKAGNTTVTIKYTNGDNAYECSFNVTVYAIESVKFTEPKKTEYLNHDDKLDFNKGYLTVTSVGGDLVKYIDLSEEMVSGKDFTKVTTANRVTPYEQNLTITYGDYSFPFTIYITYSGISVINDAFESLASANANNLTSVEGEIAVDAAKEYFKLAPSEKKSFDKDKINNLMICASIHGMALYKDSLDDFEKIFTLEINDDIISVNFAYESTYADVLNDMARIKDPNESFNVYGPLLRNIRTEFASLKITESENAAQYLFVHTEENQNLIVGIFDHFIEVHDLLKDIPTDWTDDDLIANGDNILIAVTRIAGADFNAQRTLYAKILSPWREKNDLFDILYYYYLYLVEGSDKFLKDTMWDKVPLPNGMLDWFNALGVAVNAYSNLKVGSDTYLADITYFMHTRRLAFEAHEKMKQTDNQFYLDLLALYDGDYIYQHDLNSFAFNQINGTHSFSKKLEAVWEAYLDIYALTLDEDEEFTVEGNEHLYQKMLDAFFALTPTETYAFLCSLNYQFEESLGSIKVLDYTYDEETGTYTFKNIFSEQIALYIDTVLGKENSSVFKTLLYAIESYAVFGERLTATEDFKGYMEELNSAFALLSDADKEIFRGCAGVGYDKYLEIYAAVTADTEIDLSNSPVKEDIDTFLSKIEILREIANFIAGLDKEKEIEKIYAHRILSSAIFEHADVYYQRILAAAENDPDLALALYTNLYEIDGEMYTLAKAYAFAISEHDKYMFKSGITITYGDDPSKGYTVWEYYPDTIQGIVKLHADLLYASFKNDFTGITSEYVAECIASILNPTNMQYNLLKVFYGDTLIYDAYNAYFAYAYESDAKTVTYAKKLLEAHTAYCVYFVATQETKSEAKEAFISAYNTVQELDKNEADADFFDMYLEAILDFLNEKYDALMNPAD